VLIYRLALQTGELGRGAAFSLIMIVINLVIALVYLRVLRERRQT
jgi:multiple sugar transport system permease protein